MFKLKFKLKKLHHSKQACRPRINTCCTNNPEKNQQFSDSLGKALADAADDGTVESKWSHLREAIYNSASSAYGKRQRKSEDWYEASWEEMEPVTEAKRKVLLAYKKNPTQSTRDALRAAKNKAQQAARRCANTYWLNLCSSIQTAADTNDVRGLYEGIRKATGPTSSKTAPLKSKSGEIITDQAKQLERWVEHYLELYATQNIVTDTALEAIPNLSVMEELDTPPTLGELSKSHRLSRMLQGPW